MAIQGLISPEVVTQPKPLDINDAAAVTTEALSILNMIGPDREAAYESISAEYRALTEVIKDTNETGELYVDIPYSTIATAAMVEAIDGRSFGGYPETYVYDNLWTPGIETGSYTDADLAKSSGNEPTAQLARYADEVSEEPLLHFLNMPYDDYAKKEYNPEADKTQLEAIAEQKDALESVYPEFVVSALGHRAFLLLGLQHRIKGQKMPVSWGFMRDGNLPRTKVGRNSVVGFVSSRRGQLGLGYSDGDASPYGGVGLSVGLKES